MAEKYKDEDHPPRGMQRYARWFPGIPGRSRVGISDIDGVMHSKFGDRLLILEFKPFHQRTVPVAQQFTLRALSRRERVQCVVIFDPHWNDDSDAPYRRDETIRYIVYRNGEPEGEKQSTVGKLADAIAAWYSNRGPLHEDVPEGLMAP